MRARRLSIALVALVVLGACGSPDKPADAGDKSDKSTLPSVSAGSLMPDALTDLHCARHAKGVWRARGKVTNTTKKKLSFDALIHVGPAGKDARVPVQRVDDVKPGKSVDWRVDKVSAESPDGPCQIQARVAK